MPETPEMTQEEIDATVTHIMLNPEISTFYQVALLNCHSLQHSSAEVRLAFLEGTIMSLGVMILACTREGPGRDRVAKALKDTFDSVLRVGPGVIAQVNKDITGAKEN